MLNIAILLADVTKPEMSNILTLTWPVTSLVTPRSIKFVFPQQFFQGFQMPLTCPTGGLFRAPPPSDLRNYRTDSKNSSDIRKPWKNCRRKTNFNDLGVTTDVPGQVKVEMFDISGLATSASKISMLSANKANESAWIVSLTFVSIISCALWL